MVVGVGDGGCGGPGRGGGQRVGDGGDVAVSVVAVAGGLAGPVGGEVSSSNGS